MTTTAPAAARTTQPYQPFSLRVAGVRRLSSTFVRVTLSGDSLIDFDHHGYDQRMSLIFMPEGADCDAFAREADWMAAWRSGPTDSWAPLRVYTVRAFRPESLEVDVDFVLHGDASPASRWAGRASVGDRIVMISATPGHPVTDVAWRPPADATRLLLAADETALPAASSILERLDRPARAFLEVPFPDDCLPIAGPAEITWLVRSRGERLEPVLREQLDRVAPPGALDDVVEQEDGDVWDVPENPAGGFYAWLAGEAGPVVSLRRHLVTERGVDRRAVAFMGYWKRGRVQPN
ncbi:siderophore-interacting protein [Actinoplanes friuliensis]|jgi:NADPH-dependent ferric siderophore reductase|uniref:Siderophore-interacting protein n=1 Tax=Actinoplanes friuliensis DSM 7358 TaxID=1246995 RepID=U5W7C5_9ACTN|nr:siderophore-interacting protein [Actinoplanes friuliensis]AGZ44912.1 Siderophore-interacting protein [Actinoplanes friuliensis DSM 7358]